MAVISTGRLPRLMKWNMPTPFLGSWVAAIAIPPFPLHSAADKGSNGVAAEP